LVLLLDLSFLGIASLPGTPVAAEGSKQMQHELCHYIPAEHYAMLNISALPGRCGSNRAGGKTNCVMLLCVVLLSAHRVFVVRVLQLRQGSTGMQQQECKA
jgi:hypothetical protein